MTGGQGGGLRRRLGSPRSQGRGTAGAPALSSRARESTSRGDGTRRGVGRGDGDKIAGRKVRAWTGLRAILPETDSDPDPAAERLLTRRRSPRRRQGDAGVVTAAGPRTRGGRAPGPTSEFEVERLKLTPGNGTRDLGNLLPGRQENARAGGAGSERRGLCGRGL